ncbi:hypothetical protein GUJ93_ZPchr0003g17557 [Zizania palustris]|uniref:Uncharacterized protein n=1 Tax=Zizania palustris TaxID=103762 RepID=A0A8J5V770_ZIZPA|nr:hypothetical protein GUJ93_ZPchr0003g17557 [Zizania palustris]
MPLLCASPVHRRGTHPCRQSLLRRHTSHSSSPRSTRRSRDIDPKQLHSSEKTTRRERINSDRWHLMCPPASGICIVTCTPPQCSSGRRSCSSPSSSRSGSFCSTSDRTATQQSRSGSSQSCLWCLYMPVNLLQIFSDNFTVAFRILLGLRYIAELLRSVCTICLWTILGCLPGCLACLSREKEKS